MNFLHFFFLASISSVLMTRCTPVAVVATAGIATGVVLSKHKGPKAVWTDNKIRTAIYYRWMQAKPPLFSALSASVHNGYVVIQGVLGDQMLKEKAAHAIQDIAGIEGIINAVMIGPKETWGGYRRDAWITAKLCTTLLWDQHVASRNYTICTVDRIVYLTGTARSKKEIERVKVHAAMTSGVRAVIDYVQLKDKDTTYFNTSTS